MGFAFDPDGRLFVGNRERGEVFGPITRGDNPPPVYASGLGAVADIAFDEAGYLYFGVVPWWSALSVSPDGKTLYVRDSNADTVYTISL